jgi:hypothetical protein
MYNYLFISLSKYNYFNFDKLKNNFNSKFYFELIKMNICFDFIKNIN